MKISSALHSTVDILFDFTILKLCKQSVSKDAATTFLKISSEKSVSCNTTDFNETQYSKIVRMLISDTPLKPTNLMLIKRLRVLQMDVNDRSVT